MVSSLSHKIVDLSAQLAFREEQTSQQSRASKEAMDDLIAMNDKLAQHAAAMKEMTAAREKMEAEYWAMREELEEARRQKGAGAAAEARRHEEARERWEAESAELRRQLMECAAENQVLSKSLQERGLALVTLSDAKARAETDLRLLQVRLESLDADLGDQKYQNHLLSKELQLRRDECQLSQKAADAAHRQRLDGVRKVAKLEAECQRLRGLLRQRLPGPAVLAQMRAESDHLIGLRKPKPPSTSPARNSSNNNDVRVTSMAREIDCLTDRLASLEDETTLLKETLSRRTAELQAARQLCARTATKLSSAEGLLEALARGESPPLDQHKPAPHLPSPAANGGRLHLRECAESMEVMDLVLSSEEGGINDDEISCAESWASALITELSHLKNEEPAASCQDQINPSSVDADRQSCKTNDSIISIHPASAASSLDTSHSTLQTLTNKLSLLTDTLASLEPKYPMDDQNNAELRLNLVNALHVCSELKPMLSGAMQAKEAAYPTGEIVSGPAVEKACEDVSKEDAVNIGSDGPASAAKMALLKVAANLKFLADEAPAQSTDGNAPTVDLDKLAKELIQDMEDNHGRLQLSSEQEVAAVLVRLLNALRCFFGRKHINDLLEQNSAKGQASDEEERSGVESVGRSEVTDEVGFEAMVQSLRAEMEVMQNEKQEMESKLREAEEELESKRARLAELQAEMEQLRHANACIEKELADTSARNSDFEAQLSSARADVTSLQARVAQLTSELEAQARHSLELQGTLANLSDAGMPGRKSTDSDVAPDGKARKERQVAAAKAQLAECQRSILALGNQLRTLTSGHEGSSPMEGYDATLAEGGGLVTDAAMAQLQVKTRSRQRSGFLRTRGGRLITAEQFWGSLSDRAAATPLHAAASYSLGSQLAAVAPLDVGRAATCLQLPLHDYLTEAAAAYRHVSPPETALSSPVCSPARFAVQLEQVARHRGPAVATSAVTLLDSINEATDVARNPAKSPKPSSTSRIARFFSRSKNPRQ